MADDDQAPWDEQLDQYIAALEPVISDQFSISLRDLLINPDKFAGTKDMGKKVDSIKIAVDKFFSDLMIDMDAERSRLNHEMENANMQYMKMNDTITSKTLAARVPYIKPIFVTSNPDEKEEVVVDQYNNSIDSLINKFIGISNYVADVSAKYKTYTLGSWIFSGEKVYMLSINQPTSIVIMLENNNNTIDTMIDSVAAELKANVQEK